MLSFGGVVVRLFTAWLNMTHNQQTGVYNVWSHVCLNV